MARPALVWFRQDLRLADQAALAAAAAGGPVVALYVLDDETPGAWRMGGAQRWWLHHSLKALGEALERKGVPLVLRRGRATEAVARLAAEVGATQVHALAHPEPWWREAEAALAERLDLILHPGLLLAEPDQVRTGSGGRYRIFTPFWRALRAILPPPAPLRTPAKLEPIPRSFRSDRLDDWRLLPRKPDWATGFSLWKPGEAGAHLRLRRFKANVAAYDEARNLPAEEGSSRLSPHLHFGELSPAQVWHALADAAPAAEPFFRELGWRDFAAGLIGQFPDYGEKNGRRAYDRLRWRTGAAADRDFAAWTKGLTGYPIVDAGMRQLWATGWMHNRVRMIAASFLTKHLLIDWRRGERWFWNTLVDADYGNNSLNWQWVAGTGIDSSPFGRIMAPLTQSAKFDAADYIRQWVPELAALDDHDIHDPHGAGRAPPDYPQPLIGHREGRERALAAAAGIGG